MRKRIVVASSLIAVLGAFAGSASAGVVYTNFAGSAPLFMNAGSTVGSNFDIAFPFAPSASATFSELDVALNAASSSDAGLIELTDDTSGKPGTILETWSVSNLPGTCCTAVPLTYAAGTPASGPITLNAGSSYWVALLPTGASEVGWYVNNASAYGYEDFDTGLGWQIGGSTNTLGAFQVLGSNSGVPEPAAWQLAGLGLLAAAFARRRAR